MKISGELKWIEWKMLTRKDLHKLCIEGCEVGFNSVIGGKPNNGHFQFLLRREGTSYLQEKCKILIVKLYRRPVMQRPYVKYMLLQWQMLMPDMVKIMTTVSQKTATNTLVQHFIFYLIIMVLHDVT